MNLTCLNDWADGDCLRIDLVSVSKSYRHDGNNKDQVWYSGFVLSEALRNCRWRLVMVIWQSMGSVLLEKHTYPHGPPSTRESRPDLSLELQVSRIPFGISLAREERYFKPCASRILCRATGEYSRLGAPLTGSFKYRDSTVNLALRKDVSQPTGSRHRQRRVFLVRFASGNTRGSQRPY